MEGKKKKGLILFLVLFFSLQISFAAAQEQTQPTNVNSGGDSAAKLSESSKTSTEGCGIEGMGSVLDCKFLLGYEIASMKGKGFFTNGSTFLQYSAIANIWSGLNALLDARFTQVQKEDNPQNDTTTHRVQSGYLAAGGYFAFHPNTNEPVFIGPFAKIGFEATVEQFQTKRFINGGLRVGIERIENGTDGKRKKKELLSYFDVGIGNDESLGSGPKYVFDGMLIAEKIPNAPPLFLSISGAVRANDESKDPDDFRIRVGIKVSIEKVADIIGSLFNIVTPDKKPEKKSANTTASIPKSETTTNEEDKK